MQYSFATLALAAFAAAKQIDIDVGKSGLSFSPASVVADTGDTVVFHFYSQNTAPHSVATSEFDTPCTPADGFFSGSQSGSSTGSVTFSVNITSTDPIWYYCATPGHCTSAQMVGAINPPAGKTQTQFAANAAKAKADSAPSSPSGGVSGSVPSATAGSGSSTSSSSGSQSTGSGSSTTSSGGSPTTSGSSSSTSGVNPASTSGTSSSSSSAAEPTGQAKLGAMAVAAAGGLFALMV